MTSAVYPALPSTCDNHTHFSQSNHRKIFSFLPPIIIFWGEEVVVSCGFLFFFLIFISLFISKAVLFIISTHEGLQSDGRET